MVGWTDKICQSCTRCSSKSPFTPHDPQRDTPQEQTRPLPDPPHALQQFPRLHPLSQCGKSKGHRDPIKVSTRNLRRPHRHSAIPTRWPTQRVLVVGVRRGDCHRVDVHWCVCVGGSRSRYRWRCAYEYARTYTYIYTHHRNKSVNMNINIQNPNKPESLEYTHQSRCLVPTPRATVVL